MEDNYHDQQAEGLISMDRLRSKLASLGEERADLERRVAHWRLPGATKGRGRGLYYERITFREVGVENELG
jgi:hypothetical protein